MNRSPDCCWCSTDFRGRRRRYRCTTSTAALFARIDIGWPEYRVGVDFEGKHHWTEPRQRDWDVERYAKLSELGWLDTRVTARILHNRRQAFFDRVEAALVSRGCPKTW